MLFIAEYEVGWEGLETAVAKRLTWPDVMPEGFEFVGEYIWHNGEPPFRGMAIFRVEQAEDLNAFVMHYGPTVSMRIHAATDLMTAIKSIDLVE